MNPMISVISMNPDMFVVYTKEIYGGIEIIIELNNTLVEQLNWIKSYKAELDKEIELRAKNLALASQYDAYKCMLKLTSD